MEILSSLSPMAWVIVLAAVALVVTGAYLVTLDDSGTIIEDGAIAVADGLAGLARVPACGKRRFLCASDQVGVRADSGWTGFA